MNAAVLEAFFPATVTVTETTPVPAGDVAVILVVLVTVYVVAGVVPNLTPVTPVTPEKPVPVITTVVPPEVGPLDGVIVLIVGAGVTDVAVVHVDGRVIVSSLSVTAAWWAKTRPATVTFDVRVIDVRARMLPTKVLVEPKVAELPTFQNTLHAWASPISMTVLSDEVIRLEPAWKTNTELGSPFPLRVRVPVRCSVDVALYTPGTRLFPPMLVVEKLVGVVLERPAASV